LRGTPRTVPDVPRSLASVYEPEPATEPTGSTAATSAAATATLSIPDEMKKSSIVYLEKKLNVWTVADANRELGDSISYRETGAPVPSDIYAYSDPTKMLRQFELSFAKESKRLVGVYAYPWSLNWEQCKKLWGENAKKVRNPDGTRFYMYRDRRMNVYANNHGDVISLGLY